MPIFARRALGQGLARAYWKNISYDLFCLIFRKSFDTRACIKLWLNADIKTTSRKIFKKKKKKKKKLCYIKSLSENVSMWPHLHKFLSNRKRMNGYLDKRKALRRKIRKIEWGFNGSGVLRTTHHNSPVSK